MAKTGSPYLEQGESLILTTDRISINTVQYDMLLTSRYLILVDAGYTQLQPQKIPLLTIQSVKGGKTANGELVITLFFAETDSAGKSDSMILLFSRQPGEQRKRERDDWLKTIMGLIVSVRQETSYGNIIEADPEIGIRPAKRRQIAPDIPHPYKKVVESRPGQVELIIIPDEPEPPVVSEENQEIPEISSPGEKTGIEVSPAPCAAEEIPAAQEERSESPETPVHPVPVAEGLPCASPEQTEQSYIISPLLPDIGKVSVISREVSVSPDTWVPSEVPIVESAPVPCEESASLKTATLVPAFGVIPHEGEAESGSQKTVTVSLMAPVKSLSSPSGFPEGVDAGLIPHPGSGEQPVAISELTVLPETLPLQKEPGIDEISYNTEDSAESISPQKASAIEEKPVVSAEESASPDTTPSAEPVTFEFPVITGQETISAEPVSPEERDRDEPVQSPAPQPTSPAPGSPPPAVSRKLTFIAAAAIILIILGIAGVMVFSSQNPTGSAVETTTLPTPVIQQAPQPTPVIIPPIGVWVRVGYPGSYYGWVGNAGSIRGVSGSGDQIYKIPETEGIVQVQMYKPDNSGDTLSMEVYRNGEVISLRNVSTPMGSVELLIDAKTGNPPALTPVVTPTGNQTGSNVGLIMYF